MKRLQIQRSQLQGSCHLPSSKSQSIRAILFASLATGKSQISNVLPSPDIRAMVHACLALGAKIESCGNQLSVIGLNGKPKTPDNVIDCGNSGQVLRFIPCLAGLQNGYVVVTGDSSIRTLRPVTALINGLRGLGLFCETLRGDPHAPLILRGPFQTHQTSLTGEDSQPVSGLLMAAAFREGETQITVSSPGETPWIDLTLSWLDKMGVFYENNGYEHYRVIGNPKQSAFQYTVPGDLSSLAFPLVAALLTQSALMIHGVDLAEPQGDKAIIEVLRDMGATIVYDDNKKTLSVPSGCVLRGKTVDINHMIDSICVLAVVGCTAIGETRITGAAIAKQKECNRIEVICASLSAMGADIQTTDDGLVIRQSQLHGATLFSHHDHRIAMALSIAGLIATGKTIIEDTACIDKSYPDFANAMQAMGAAITT